MQPENPAPPLVSVIVVNWNRRDLLAACLRSLAGQTFTRFETIVIDNGSTDGSAEGLLELPAAGFRIIQNVENRGFCAANNQGIAAATGKYVALLNNDAEADPRWLEALVGLAEQHPESGMIASKILSYADRRRIDKVGHLIYPDGQNRGRGTGEIDEGQYDQIEEVAWPDGCAALYRKRMLDEIGGFDEDFFAYADDAELGLRGRIAGWTCLYTPHAVVYHRLASTLGRFSARRLFLIERNRIWLVVKLFPKRLWPAVPLFFGLRVAASAVASLQRRGEAGRAAAEIGAGGLIQSLIRANLSAMWRVPAMLRKRRRIAAFRKLNGGETAALLRRHRISLAELVSRSA